MTGIFKEVSETIMTKIEECGSSRELEWREEDKDEKEKRQLDIGKVGPPVESDLNGTS